TETRADPHAPGWCEKIRVGSLSCAKIWWTLMKLARFILDGNLRVGLGDTEKNSVRPLDPRYTDISDVIQAPGIEAAKAQTAPIALDGVRLVAPIIPRRNVFCVGKNYHAHAREFSHSGFEAGAVKGKEVDEYPAIFSKPPTS